MSFCLPLYLRPHFAWAPSGREYRGLEAGRHHAGDPSTGPSGTSTLKESEAARYENGDQNFMVTGYRLQDTTGAMAAFDWQRPPKSTASKLAPLAAEREDGLLVVHGNYLLSFTGHKPDAAELGALFDGLRNVDTTVLPILPANLPAQDRVPNSERYITGPASLAKFAPSIPPSVAAFHYGAEGQMDFFNGPAAWRW
jgi:hypothetical protein